MCLLLVVSIARGKDGRREAEEKQRVVNTVMLLNGEAGGGLNVVVTIEEKNGISQ